MIVKLAVKTGLTYGALTYACNQGVWGNSVQTEELYNKIKGHACPYVVQMQKKLPFDVPALPKTGEVRFLAKHYYNQGVKSTFNFIQMLPCYAGQWMKKGKQAIDKALEPQKPSN